MLKSEKTKNKEISRNLLDRKKVVYKQIIRSLTVTQSLKARKQF